jgi:hypothetical protein
MDMEKSKYIKKFQKKWKIGKIKFGSPSLPQKLVSKKL